ncbi:MAG: MMPL family transporter, partial [Myxococcota bacterium]
MRETRAWRFFWGVTAYPRTVLSASLALIAVSLLALPQLTRDTRSEAFIPADHPAVVYREKVREIFGLSDPIVVAVVNAGPHGVFNPDTLRLIDHLTREIADLPNVDSDRVTSLATENDIVGTEDGMLVDPFFEEPPDTQAEATRIRNAVLGFDLYVGSLVSEDGSATLIIAELLDGRLGEEVHEQVLAIVARSEYGSEEIHVAGEGAVVAKLGSYIDADAARLNPFSALLITMILIVAYRTVRGVLLPNLVVLGAVAFALGSMSVLGVPIYVITNALPPLLIAVAVADSIHILGQYYEEVADNPEASSRELAVRSMTQMWRPIT